MSFPTFEVPFFLAPMEAVNCAAFRVLCKRRGASLVYTDMIDADVFSEYAREHGAQKALDKYVNAQKEEYPLAIQLGGANSENLVYTINIIQPIATTIDLNIGCPLSYMLGKKGGVYLMKHPTQLYKLVTILREAITIAFSIKIRAGWDESSINAVEIAQGLEKLGVDAIGIHPRTRKQRAQGAADWQLARKVKDAVSIPVILSGDVTNAYMAYMAFLHTKCDYIMLARGAQHNPGVFKELLHYWKKKEQPPKPLSRYNKTKGKVRKDFDEFLDLYQKLEQTQSVSQVRDHALWFAKECQHNKYITQKLMDASSIQEIHKIIHEIKF